MEPSGKLYHRIAEIGPARYGECWAIYISLKCPWGTKLTDFHYWLDTYYLSNFKKLPPLTLPPLPSTDMAEFHISPRYNPRLLPPNPQPEAVDEDAAAEFIMSLGFRVSDRENPHL